MQNTNNSWSIFKKHKNAIIVFLILTVALPSIICGFRYFYDNVVDTYDVAWLGFFGSYVGGVLGGGATLIAVLYTIQNNKEEQAQKEEKERQELIRKSSFMVYNDMFFTFNSIKAFMSMFWTKRLEKHSGSVLEQELEKLTKEKEDELTSYEFTRFKECLNQFSQFYFDSNWINIVADLKDSSQIERDKIRKICEVYGCFMKIKRSFIDSNLEVYKHAYNAMNEIIDFKTAHLENGIIIFEEKREVADLLKKLENIAYNYID